MTAIVVEGGTDVPAVKCVRGPSATIAGLDVDEHFGAGWSKRGAVVIERAMDLGPSGESRIDSRSSEQVQGEDGMGHQPVPKMERKVGVSAGKASDKMILERADGTFSGVGSVDARGNKLEVDVLLVHEFLQNAGALIVEALELGSQASMDEAVVDGFEGE